MKKIVLAGGCFWGIEDLFRKQPGVVDTEAGYAGGISENPTYENHSGHAEALQISYDNTKTNLQDLLDFFFRIHDPTTVNRQGNDAGESYRSAIFYQNEDEKLIAEQIIGKVNATKFWPKPIVTTLEPLTKFWPAENYHQDYLVKNPSGYTCHFLRSETPLTK